MSSVSLLTEEIHDFVALVEGYHRLFVDKDSSLLKESPHTHNNNSEAGGQYY